jgi:hypothetical protein
MAAGLGLAGPGIRRAFVSIAVATALTVLPAAAQRIDENPASPIAKNAGRVVVLKEVMRIEDEGEAYFFRRPFGLRVRGDGAVFIQEQEQLLHFDKDGRFVRNYFEKGQGPGEMVYVSDFLAGEAGLVVLALSPPKVMTFDRAGALTKEFTYRSKSSGGLRFVSRAAGENVVIGRDSPFANPPKTEGIVDSTFHVLTLKDGEETLDDRAAFPVPVFIIPSTGGGGGVIDVNSFFAVPLGKREILLTHTSEYLLKVFDVQEKKIVRQFRREYERVKLDPESKKKGGVIIDGKHYYAAPVKYEPDINNLIVVGDRFWVVTSTIDRDKGGLVDVFDRSGRYVDRFYLKFPENANLKTLVPNQTTVSSGHVYAIIETDDGTYAVVKYRIDDPDVQDSPGPEMTVVGKG